MEQSDIQITKGQKIESVMWVVGIILACLALGGFLLAAHDESWLVTATGGIYLAAGIALPTLLLVGWKKGKVRTPVTTLRDRVWFAVAIGGLIGFGIVAPTLLHLFT